jgi:AcrR family transcriptional regulator
VKRSNTKGKILQKATDLFYEHGFVKASIRDIVKAVGVTNSTVYIHFRNKDEILYSIIEDIGSTLITELQKVGRKHDDPIVCLREMIFRQVCLIKEKRKEIRIYVEEQYQLPPPLRKKALAQQRQIFDIYHNKIGELKEKGFTNEVDQTVVTFCIFATMNWAYRWFRDRKRLTIEEVAQDMIRILFSGILRNGVPYGGQKGISS